MKISEEGKLIRESKVGGLYRERERDEKMVKEKKNAGRK